MPQPFANPRVKFQRTQPAPSCAIGELTIFTVPRFSEGGQ